MPPPTATIRVSDRLVLVEIVGRLPYASNATFLSLDGEGRQWVYKPDRGEQPLWDFSTGTLSVREVLTWEAAEAMGLGLVPETRLAEGRFGPGSAQAFIEEDVEFDPRTLFEGPSDLLWPVAVLDVVTNNADRKIGHIISEADTGRLWAIDNALTFHHEDKLRTVLWDFAGQNIPPALVTAAGLLTEFAHRVGEALGRREGAALRRRVTNLLDRPIHPYPPTDRPPIPWPIW